MRTTNIPVYANCTGFQITEYASMENGVSSTHAQVDKGEALAALTSSQSLKHKGANDLISSAINEKSAVTRDHHAHTACVQMCCVAIQEKGLVGSRTRPPLLK
jgi:hypothetical protein